jgi:hypothetical protein
MITPDDDFQRFLFWERASRDSLELKRVYIDMAGDLVAGVVLSQIVYWHLPSREGRPRLQVKREGRLWLAKTREAWWQECRVSPKQADRALAVLETRGLIETHLFRFAGAPTKHVRIVPDGFLRAWKEQLGTPSGQEGTTGGEEQEVATEDAISPEGRNPFSPEEEVHFPQRVRSSTEITAETTATARGGVEKAAAAELIASLTAQGVGRAAARRLVREKPDVCRRCLAYLPHAEIRTTPGAWLANAIRDEYGPPARFLEARSREKRAEQGQRREASLGERRARQAARKLARLGDLRKELGRLEEAGGEALAAYCRFVDQERGRLLTFLDRLSPARRDTLLASFESPEGRLELFERWSRRDRRGTGCRRDAPLPDRPGSRPDEIDGG